MDARVVSAFTRVFRRAMPAHDVHGLVHCYVAALPFLYNTVAGDVLWTTLLFGIWWSAKVLLAPKVKFQYVRQIRSAPSPMVLGPVISRDGS